MLSTRLNSTALLPNFDYYGLSPCDAMSPKPCKRQCKCFNFGWALNYHILGIRCSHKILLESLFTGNRVSLLKARVAIVLLSCLGRPQAVNSCASPSSPLELQVCNTVPSSGVGNYHLSSLYYYFVENQQSFWICVSLIAINMIYIEILMIAKINHMEKSKGI